MDLCYRFIADVFDTPSVDPRDYIANKELDLDAILESQALKLNMLYTIVWNAIYNTFPTKYDYRDYLARTTNTPQHDISTILQSFLILKVVAFDMNALQKKCGAMLQHISNKDFLKTKILEKWHYRYYPHFPQPTQVKDNIFNIYITHIKKVLEAESNTIDPVIFEGLPSGNIDFHPSFHALKYATQPERLQYMIHKDFHFCRRLSQNGMIIVDTNTPQEDLDILIDVTETELVIEASKITPVLPFLPKIAKMLINLTELSISDATLTLKDLITTWPDKLSPKEFKKGYYKALVNNARELVYFKHVVKNVDLIQKTLEKSVEPPAMKRENVIVLIDNRPNIMSAISVIFALRNTDPTQWNVRVYTSTRSKSFYETLLGASVEVRTLQALDTPRFNIDVYNKIMMSEELWTELKPWKKTLIIQDDGVLMRPGVERFLKWDYVGSPWIDAPDNEYLKTHVYKEMVGNGGLSLRSTQAMLDIVSKYQAEKNQLFYHNLVRIPEDVYFVKAMVKEGVYKLPDKSTASEFASEQIVNMKSLGFHKVWAYNDLAKVQSYFSSI